jgi:glycolate oxidase iron-sulfur subunit
MRTNFSPAQLAIPDIAEANGILETCVHYGFCTNTCPTYVVTRDENDSPRGRIDLIRAMPESGGAPAPKTVHHLDRCLSCLSCMTTCAVKVDYVHLIDRARAHIERHYARTWPDRLLRRLLAAMLSRPRLFLPAIRLGHMAKPLGPLLPGRLRGMLDLIPAAPRPHILHPQVFRAEGPAKTRLALLAGCAQQALEGSINAATIRILQRHGCDVVVAPGSRCCGSLALHMGREADAIAMARANVEAWWREAETDGLDGIVVNASGCGSTVKDYGHLLARQTGVAENARRIAALAYDVSEVLSRIGLRTPIIPTGYRVAYHDPCSMQHVQHVTREPRELLRSAGFEVLNIPENHFCCGSAGTYNLLQPEMAEALGRRKADHISGTQPDIIATGNIGCITQLRRYLPIPIVHTVELLDWATGGPLPPALDGVSLRNPSVRETVKPAALSGDNAIW